MPCCLRPLPYPEPIVSFFCANAARALSQTARSVIPTTSIGARGSIASLISHSLGAITSISPIPGGRGRRRSASAARVITSNYLKVLEMKPMIGRDLHGSRRYRRERAGRLDRRKSLAHTFWRFAQSAWPANDRRRGRARDRRRSPAKQVTFPRLSQIWVPLAELRKAPKSVISRGNHPGFILVGPIEARRSA